MAARYALQLTRSLAPGEARRGHELRAEHVRRTLGRVAMTGTPLCPLALAVLARGPRRAHELARALGRDHGAAVSTLRRLQEHGLVRRRDVAAGPVFQITRRGSAALALQRLLWSRVVGAGR